MPTVKRDYDVVIYGATGYSGRLVCEEMCRVLKDSAVAPKHGLKWAIAGRSLAQLDKLMDQFRSTEWIQHWCPDATLVASVDDPEALDRMASSTTLILNCAGPFSVCGEPVLQACLRCKTHYTDITGEPGFLNASVWPLHEKAIEESLYFVPCVGFDCVPAEIGTYRVLEARKTAFFSTMASPSAIPSPLADVLSADEKRDPEASPTLPKCVVDTFVRYNGSLSNGTFYTLLNSIKAAGAGGGGGQKKPVAAAGDASSKPAPPALPKLPRVTQRGPSFSKIAHGWVAPLLSADPQLIARCYAVGANCSRVLRTLGGYRHWVRFPGFLTWLRRTVVITIFFMLAKTKCGRSFLQWWRGTKHAAGPSVQERKNETSTVVCMTTEVDSKLKEAHVQTFKAIVEGTHVYDYTASAAVLASCCLIQWLDKRQPQLSRGDIGHAPLGGAWTLASLFSQLPHTSNHGPHHAGSPTLLDDFEARMSHIGAMNITIRP